MENNALAERLRALSEQGKYAEQGEVFLKATGSTLEVVEAVPQKSPAWESETLKREKTRGALPIHYACKLSNKHGSYSFDFWGSIADAEQIERARELSGSYSGESPLFFQVSDFLKRETGRGLVRGDVFRAKSSAIVERVREAVKPNAYAILTALHDDAGDDFADFCANYGYDEDSRSAERVYHAVLEQERNMRRLFDRDELEALREIV